MRTAALASAFLLLAACPRRPVDFGKGGEPTSDADLLARLRAAELSVVSVKGEAKLKAETSRGSGTAGLFVAVKEPAFIHLQALDFFGRPLAQLVSDGSVFGLYDAQAGKYFKGPASAANLRRVLPVVIPPADLASLFLGRVPRVDGEPKVTFDAEKGRWRLEYARQTVEVEPPSYRAVSSHAAYDVELAGIEERGGVSFPSDATLSAGGSRMELHWKDVELNVTPEADLFEMTPPENVPVVEVDAQGYEVSH
ncbi:MAG: DUF4292 domain-containing protein [Myxococcaceae bacterium]|nr:DUF4292 domain-containing protein [Myxococcaceae bacterium]